MTSSLCVYAVPAHGPVVYREVSIGGPSTTYEPNDENTFYGEYITVANNEGKNILSVRGGEVSTYKNSGEIVALGEYVSVDNDPNTLSGYNVELCFNPITGDMIVLGDGSLTSDSEQKTISLINAKDKRGTTVSVISGSFHTIPGKSISLIGDNIGMNHHDYPMNITVLGEKSEDGTKAKLNIDENRNVTSLDGGSIVFEHGKTILSVIDGDACIDMPNDYTSLNGESIVLRYGEDEISVSDCKMHIDHTKGKISMNGGDANFRLGKENRFVPKVKEADIDCATGTVYCNGEVICRTLLLKEIWELLFANPKPASALAS